MNQHNMNTSAAPNQSTLNDQPNISWKTDIKTEERSRFISQLGKALKSLSPDTSDNTIFSVVKAYELNAFNKSVNKSQYTFAYWKKLQQIKLQQQSHSGTTSLMTNDSQLLSNPNQMTGHQVSSMQRLPSQVQQFQNNSPLINQHQNMNSQIQTETNFSINMIQAGTLQSQNLQTNPSQTQFLGLQNVASEAMAAPTTPGVTDGSNTSSINMMGNVGSQQQTTATMLPQTNMTHPNTNVTMTPGELRMFLSHQIAMQKNYQNLQQGAIPQFNNPSADPFTLMNLNIPNNVTQNFPFPASSVNSNNTTMQVNNFQNPSQDLIGHQYMDQELLMQLLQQQSPTQAQNSSQQQAQKQAQQQAQKRAQEKALKMAQAEKNKSIAERQTLVDQQAWAQQQTLNQTQMQKQHRVQNPSPVYSQTQIHSQAQQQAKSQQQGYNQTQTQHQAQTKPQQQVFAQTHTQTQNQVHAQTQQQIHTQTQQQTQQKTHAQTQNPSQGMTAMQTQQQRVQVQSFAPTLQQRTQAAEYIRQLEESLRKSRVVSRSIEGLPEVEKKTIYNGMLLVKSMYDKLDKLLPVFYALTFNVEATKKLLLMKYMFEDQLDALERNEFVITTEQLIKLKEQFIKYYNWVRNAVIPSNQMASQNTSLVQQPSQHQEADQGQAKTSPVQQSQLGSSTFLMPPSERIGTKRSGVELQPTTNKKQKGTPKQKATPKHTTIDLTQNPSQYQNNAPEPHNQTAASPLPPSGSIGIKRGSIDLQLPANKKQKANRTPKQTMVQTPPQQSAPLVNTATSIQRQAQAQLSRQAAITYGLPLEIVDRLPPRALQCCWILQQETQNLMILTPTQQQYIHEQLNHWVAEARLRINQAKEQERKQAEVKAQEQRQAEEEQRLAQEQKEADEKRQMEEERRAKEQKKAQELKQANKLLKTPTVTPKPQFPTRNHTTIQQRSQKPPIYPQSLEEQLERTMTPPQESQLPAPLPQMTPPQIQASRPMLTQLTPPQIQASQLPTQKIPSPRLTPGTALKMSVMNDQYQSPLLYQNDIQEEIALLFSQSVQTKKANKNQVALQPDGPHNALLFEPFPIDGSDDSDEKKTISEDEIADTWYEVGMETGVPEMYDIFGGFAFDDFTHQDFVST